VICKKESLSHSEEKRIRVIDVDKLRFSVSPEYGSPSEQRELLRPYFTEKEYVKPDEVDILIMTMQTQMLSCGKYVSLDGDTAIRVLRQLQQCIGRE